MDIIEQRGNMIRFLDIIDDSGSRILNILQSSDCFNRQPTKKRFSRDERLLKHELEFQYLKC